MKSGRFPGELLPAEEMIIVLTWKLGLPPETCIISGVYVLDEEGAVSQHDGPGFDSVQWRVGDSFTLPSSGIRAHLPAGTYRTAVALYTWPDLVPRQTGQWGQTAYLETIPWMRLKGKPTTNF